MSARFDLMDLFEHLRRSEQDLLEPAIRRDARRLSELLAPGFREFGSSGRTYTRAEIIAALALEQTGSSPTVSLTDFTIVAASDSWALVTYRSHRHDPGGTPQATSLRSSTWILLDGRWQMLFHQGTPEFTRTPDADIRSLIKR